MSGRRGHAWRYLPSKAPPAPGRGRCAPSSPTVGPSSELASAPNHPIRPTTAGAPPLDAGADGACLEVPPVQSPPGPLHGKMPPQTRPTTPNSKSSYPAPHGRAPPPPRCWGEGGMPPTIPRRKPSRPPARQGVPLRPPLLAHVEPAGQAIERTGEYPQSPKCPLSPGQNPRGHLAGAMPPPRCCLPVPMVSEPTGQQTCRSDTGPRPAVWLPPPSARRCRNN